MFKFGFGATMTVAALVLTIAVGASLYRLQSATASPLMQTVTMNDVSAMMIKMDTSMLPEETWPAI